MYVYGLQFDISKQLGSILYKLFDQIHPIHQRLLHLNYQKKFLGNHHNVFTYPALEIHLGSRQLPRVLLRRSVSVVITSAKILQSWLFPSKIYIQFTIFNTYFLTKLLFTNKRYHLHVLEKCLYVLQEVRSIIYFWQFIHPLFLRSRGNGTSFAFTTYITVLAIFCEVTFLDNFYFVSFFYRLFIWQCQRKIRLVTLSKSYLYKLFFQSFFLVYWASFFHICLYFWTQIKHPKLFLKHNVWRWKTAHCIAYNNIWICEGNLLFIKYMKQIVIIIMHAATNKGWHLTLNA